MKPWRRTGAGPACWAVVAATCVCLTGCAFTPRVYDVQDRTEPTGKFRSLPELLDQTRDLRLIIVHGVGDHCPGYAIGKEEGESGGTDKKPWLSHKALEYMHMTALDDMKTVRIPATIIDAQAEPSAAVFMSKRHYQVQFPGAAAGQTTRIEAIEITWSTLTQWVKRQQLAYDGTRPFEAMCGGGPVLQPYPGLAPPQRELLNRKIKESVFDLNLAGAMLYVGAFGKLMERGLAEAVCQGVNDTPENQQCKWPNAEETAADPYRYMFITHSLGSRMVYDLLMNLQGIDTKGRPNQLREGTPKEAEHFTPHLVGKLTGIYMLANQLPLLGLANFETTNKAEEGANPSVVAPVLAAKPAFSMKFGLDLQQRAPKVNTYQVAPLAHVSAAELSKCRQPLQALGYSRVAQAARLGPAEQARAEARPLSIIAFNDTNDLLTWHLPFWYANDGGRDARQSAEGCSPVIEIQNVFVRNTPWLPVLVEDPTEAHTGYYKSPELWKAIACGADRGELKACLQ